MTYRDYIDIIDLQENGSLVVLTNTDIMLDTNILAISEVIRKNFFCVLLDMKGEKLRCSFLMRRGVRTMYGQLCRNQFTTASNSNHRFHLGCQDVN
jgi:hypothetical protein